MLLTKPDRAFKIFYDSGMNQCCNQRILKRTCSYGRIIRLQNYFDKCNSEEIRHLNTLIKQLTIVNSSATVHCTKDFRHELLLARCKTFSQEISNPHCFCRRLNLITAYLRVDLHAPFDQILALLFRLTAKYVGPMNNLLNKLHQSAWLAFIDSSRAAIQLFPPSVAILENDASHSPSYSSSVRMGNKKPKIECDSICTCQRLKVAPNALSRPTWT